MTEAGRRRRLVARTAITLLALAAATGARAGCTSNSPGNHIFALTGDSCPFASGTYLPTTPAPVTPPASPNNPIVGLFAEGGTIGASSDATSITIDAKLASTPTVSTSYGVWSDGPGSLINFFTPSGVAVPVTVSTSNGGTFGFYASGGGTIGGTIMTPEVAGVSTEAFGSPAVYALGAGSTITLTLLPPTSPALATIVTVGNDSAGALARSGGSVVLSGGSVLTSGNGSAGLDAFSGSISATGTTITTTGHDDAIGNQSAAAEVNGTGATITLTNDTFMTSGVESSGVVAAAQGTATLSGTTTTMITTTNDGAFGLYALGGGVIKVNGATEIWTGSTALSTGAGAIGIYASGTAPSSGPASEVYLNAATTVTTYGTGAFGPNSVYPYGLYASNGGLIDGSLAPSVTVTTNGTDAIGVLSLIHI